MNFNPDHEFGSCSLFEVSSRFIGLGLKKSLVKIVIFKKEQRLMSRRRCWLARSKKKIKIRKIKDFWNIFVDCP